MPDYGDDKGFQGSGSGEASTGVGDRDAADRSRDQYNRNKQITETNPYGEDGFFSRVLGIDPSKISYAGNFSTNPGQDLAIRRGIASNQFDKFTNPFRDVGQGSGKLRPGVQQAGYQTALGPVMEQYREQPMSEMLARGAFSLFGGGLPGLALSQIGTKEYGIEGTPGFDPNNPRGASGMFGEIGRVLTGGVDPSSAAAEAAQGVQAIQDFFSPDQPSPAPAATQVQQVTPSMPDREIYAEQRDRENALLSGIFGMGTQTPAPQQSFIGFPDVNRRRVGVLDDLGMTVRQLGENIVAVPGGYMNTETGRTYSGQYDPNARARTFTGTQKPQGTIPFSFGSFIENIVGQ